MYSGILLVAALGYTLNRLFLVVEARTMRWHRGVTARESA
jgi:ABC-type nitrate/sulfonate/bicarbonate transport system permease component